MGKKGWVGLQGDLNGQRYLLVVTQLVFAVASALKGFEFYAFYCFYYFGKEVVLMSVLTLLGMFLGLLQVLPFAASIAIPLTSLSVGIFGR